MSRIDMRYIIKYLPHARPVGRNLRPAFQTDRPEQSIFYRIQRGYRARSFSSIYRPYDLEVLVKLDVRPLSCKDFLNAYSQSLNYYNLAQTYVKNHAISPNV